MERAHEGERPELEPSADASDAPDVGAVAPNQEARRSIWTAGRLMTLVVVVLLIGGFALIWARQNRGGSSGVVRAGKSATNFTLPGLGGSSVRLSDYRGKVVLVNFWATWCPPCQTEMPMLQSVYQEHKGAGFVVLGVDQAEEVNTVRSFVGSHGFDWTFALDQSGETSRDYGVYSIPESFLIDRNGKVSHIWSGPLTQASLEQQLASLGIGR